MYGSTRRSMLTVALLICDSTLHN